MRIGIIGRGPWGDTYARTLRSMGVDFWQAGRDWEHQPTPDGAIVASAPDSHYRIACDLIEADVSILLEKPVCTNCTAAAHLLGKAALHDAIVFTGHTRLYSPAWREFKKRALKEGVRSVYGMAGGPCKLDPWWDWGPHLVAMCLDLGFDPHEATFLTSREPAHLWLDVNGSLIFRDVSTTPPPLEVLISEFVSAIEAGKPDIRGLELGVKVVEYLEEAAAGQDRRTGEGPWQSQAA